MNQTSFCSNSKIHQNFHNYFTTTTTFITNRHNHHTNSSTTCFQTSSTTINHDFIPNSSNYNFIIHYISQKHNIFIHMIF